MIDRWVRLANEWLDRKEDEDRRRYQVQHQLKRAEALWAMYDHMHGWSKQRKRIVVNPRIRRG